MSPFLDTLEPMALLKIYTGAAPVLRRKARPIRRIDGAIRKLAADMLETMHAAPGVGLAAPQVGFSERLIVVSYEEREYVMVNPVLTRRSAETALGEEGCLSLPSLYGDVERAVNVRVQGLDLAGKRCTIDAEEWLARIFQHELDHLDGILFTDRMAPDALLRHVSSGEAEEDI
jgi:peptide deformylase